MNHSINNTQTQKYSIEEIIFNSPLLSQDDKEIFKKVKNMLISLDNDLYLLLFHVEFASRISWRWDNSRHTTTGISLLSCISAPIISEITSTLFRLWDNGNNTNSLFQISRLINKSKNLKNFITQELYPSSTTSSYMVCKILNSIPHTKKHILMQTLQKYRNHKIGHNLNTKFDTPDPIHDVYLGNLMILSDFTLQLATRLNTVLLGYTHNFLEFPQNHMCSLALQELESILISKGFEKNSSFRRSPFKYNNETGLEQQLISSLVDCE
ncbi:hypothetical protein [Candidatus Proelusimicrobium volucris]|uniref:hypothetical protein n=1 Tax=Candidatus Proelusimicrobium volucris TaxID=3416225 RepID=UPI003D0ED632